MNYEDQKTRMRRFLRDPDAKLWTDALLRRMFNEAQRTVQQRTGVLENLQAIRVPPMFGYGYLYDWEWRHFSNTVGRNYQALRYHEAADMVFCYRWEVGAITDISDDTADEGSHFTQPWEGFVDDVTPGDPIPIWFPEDFDQALLVAWDKRPLDYIDRKRLMADDETWITHSGHEAFYYRYNDVDNCFILSPLPSSPVWDDVETGTSRDEEYVYTFDWEKDETAVEDWGDGQPFTAEDTTDEIQYLFSWELDAQDGAAIAGDSEIAMKAMYAHEIGGAESDYGIVNFITGDTLAGDEAGAMVRRDGTTFTGSYYGAPNDVIDDDDNVLVIYRSEPTAIESEEDESDFPPFLRKYVEHLCLSRAYSVDNDGKIESLRDYWTYRAELGIKLIKKYMELRKADRNYRLTIPGIPGRVSRKHPRLLDAYPAA